MDTNTITNWELNHTEPELRFLPALIEFLGYLPFEVGKDFPGRLKAYRLSRGLSQEKLARELEIDESTLWKWENGIRQPSRTNRKRVEQVVEELIILKVKPPAHYEPRH